MLGERGEIVILGGAALVLLFGARETTRDVDAYFVAPSGSKMRALTAEVARQLGLPEDWLNDAAKGFLVGVTTGTVVYESPSFVARAASTEQLLAMKLAAWRDAIDREDAGLLLRQMSGTSDEVWSAVKPMIPSPLLDKAGYAFQDLWEAVHGTA